MRQARTASTTSLQPMLINHYARIFCNIWEFLDACIPHLDGKVARVLAWTMRCNEQMPDAGPFCKHQVAWLVALAPLDHRAEAESLCVLMLGTRLGFSGGAKMEDTSSLTQALLVFALTTASITSSGIPPAAALPSFAHPCWPSCSFRRCSFRYPACSSSCF
jgi:hypothetical protein